MPRVLSDHDLRRMAEVHLAYELGMLRATAKELASGAYTNETIHNALLESFIVHLRNVMDFIWGAKARPDDVVAGDYFSDPAEWVAVAPAIPAELSPGRGRANKEVAHLTYARLDVDSTARGWNYLEMANAALNAFQVFIDHVDPTKVGSLIAPP